MSDIPPVEFRLPEEDLPPIVVFDYEDLKRIGRTPRSPEDKGLQIRLDTIDRERSVVIFVSHCWLRGYPGAPGYDGRPHPDTANHDKLKLMFKAIEKIKHGFVSDKITKIYLWLDYGCIDQDASACLELKMLDKIIQACDLMLTPIFDEAESFPWYDEFYRTGINNMYDQYSSPAWNKGDHAYLNRAWCRIEMFYAANIPLTPNSPYRLQQFKAGLLTSIQAGRRCHVLYGSCEAKGDHGLSILSPLQNSWFSKYNPIEGKLTKETDRAAVKTLVNELLPYMEFVKEGYEGERKDDKMHGKGIYRYANGNIYEGDYQDDKRNGKGIFRWAYGDVYEGDYKDDKMHGKGIYRYASGDYCEGDFKIDKYHGKGIYRSASGSLYEGDYENDREHGKGVYRYSNGNVYEGDFKDGSSNGKGTMRYADGHLYEGEFKDGKKHGEGIYRYVDGRVEYGIWEDDILASNEGPASVSGLSSSGCTV